MWIKRILIGIPFLLVLVLVQSFFWVPTYDSQTKGNPDRLLRFITASSGDAEILTPILHADTSSSEITGYVFDGLLDLDDELRYRPRLATGWVQYEEAYLRWNPDFEIEGVDSPLLLKQYVLDKMAAHPNWTNKLKSVEIVEEKAEEGEYEFPKRDAKGKPVLENGRPVMRKIPWRRSLIRALKFTLKEIDQDFFKPLEKLLGPEYFQSFPYEKMIRAQDKAEQESLASGYASIIQVTEHNPVIVFDLRRGVRFHDGHSFDSGDVLFTYQAIMNPSNLSPRRSDYEPVKKAKTLGPHKIKFTYKRLFSPAISAWSMGILPEHLLNHEALEKEARERGITGDSLKTFTLRDSEFSRHPIGTGPFRFVEWQSDEMIRLERNEDYWEGPPEYHEYIMRIIPDPLTQEMEFYSGAVDNYGVQPYQVDRLKDHPKYQSFSTVGFSYSYIGYNLRKPLFQNPEVRRALGMAIDVDQIIKYVIYDQGERVTGPYPKITDWYDPGVKPLPYDPEGALEILNRMGWKKNEEGWLEKDGKVFEFNLITNNGNPTRKAILTVVQNQWRKIGIRCNTQLFEWAVFLKDFVNSLKFDALILGWSMGTDPDLFQLWHSSQTNPKQLNFVGYKSEKADDLIVRIRQEYNRDHQVEMARELHRVIAEAQPYTFLFVNRATRLLDRKIVIVNRQPDGAEQYQKIYPVRGGNIRYHFNRWRKLDHQPEFSPTG